MTEKKCPHCGANMQEYRHKLTPGIVDDLVALANAIREAGKNDVEFKNIKMTYNQRNNFQKLRYWGFIAHPAGPNGERTRGRWLMTRNGARFLRGEISVPKEIVTWRNHIQSRSDEHTFISQIKGHHDTGEYFQKDFFFAVHDTSQEPASV